MRFVITAESRKEKIKKNWNTHAIATKRWLPQTRHTAQVTNYSAVYLNFSLFYLEFGGLFYGVQRKTNTDNNDRLIVDKCNEQKVDVGKLVPEESKTPIKESVSLPEVHEIPRKYNN